MFLERPRRTLGRFWRLQEGLEGSWEGFGKAQAASRRVREDLVRFRKDHKQLQEISQGDPQGTDSPGGM